MSADFQQWECHAQPNGKQCGHLNTEELVTQMFGERMLYCSYCGRTKHASDDRLARKLAGKR